MDITGLKRDKKKVLSSLVEIKETTLVTKVACTIQIPSRWSDRKLASIGKEVYILGIFPIILETGEYALINIPSMVQIEPLGVSNKMIQGVEYLSFEFDKGSTVIKNLNVVKESTLVYYIFDELVQKGNIPWYMTYDDLPAFIENSKEYAGANIGNRNEVTDLIVSFISRSPKNTMVYYRHFLKSFEDVDRILPTYVPLKNVTYNATSTFDKLAGAYMSEGVVSALTTTTKESSAIETFLRT